MMAVIADNETRVVREVFIGLVVWNKYESNLFKEVFNILLAVEKFYSMQSHN
jgi:hypothetical protein